MDKFVREGFCTFANGVMPSFTNPNNVSIVTGVPPSVHGISGNYFLDPLTGREVMMNDPSLMQCSTILAAFSKIGARVVVITAKDKLRLLLSHQLNEGISFSAEKADTCTLSKNGIENVLTWIGLALPDVYSGDLSLFVLRAGVKILRNTPSDLMCLSLTDYIPHKHAPGTGEANAYFHALDEAFGALAESGAIVALTADHGMNDKANADGSPRVIFLQELLDREFGEGQSRVICPITDPYVRHHGSLGSWVTVFSTNHLLHPLLRKYISALPGVERVIDRNTAAIEFDLPADRIGDLNVIGNVDRVIGSRQADHDLSALGGSRLRSHGGLSEQKVPFILSQPLNYHYIKISQSRRIRNFDIFDFAINGTQDSE
jgi:phosphonoacetate hydrolase